MPATSVRTALLNECRQRSDLACRILDSIVWQRFSRHMKPMLGTAAGCAT